MSATAANLVRKATNSTNGVGNTDAPVIRVAAPSFRAVVRAVVIVAVCGVTLFLLWRGRSVGRLCGISLFLSLTLLPLVDAIDSRIRAPRALIILFVYLLLIATVAVIGYVVVPSVVKEIHQLSAPCAAVRAGPAPERDLPALRQP